MHPRNSYRVPPDFRELAKTYPPLKPCLIFQGDSVSIDFKNEVSQRRLTEALLYRDFGIALEIPLNRLLRNILDRLNYVLWIQDIIQATQFLERSPIRGMDIGTGSSAIYPLLSCKLDPHWSFIATDVDAFSLQSARSNVEKNGLLERIQVFATSPDAPIFAPLHADPKTSIAFTMCNPPFYSSREDVAASAEAKEFEPSAVCTGADVEMITPGGESVFVRRMVDESLQIGTRCWWYTSMLGKMASLTEVISSLQGHAINNYGVTEFVQGTTRRWAVVWSFGDVRLPDSIARTTAPQLQSLMPPRNTLRQPFHALSQNPSRLAELLAAALAAVEGVRVVPLDMHMHTPNAGAAFTVSAVKNTWSRGARRRHKHAAESKGPAVPEPAAPGLVCRMQWILPDVSHGQEGSGTFLECQWVLGKDRQLFEGFASHISRKVSEGVSADPSD
ncbi:S-adenosyl-L-methionine dependent methyltransferase [Mycena pura]|uniref:S-adenosyl-L-methionine dependent methyltransferase n=1 Tax=Mycena pura TaxID=153505 RepID=A0AAD6UWA4_9AGAR|nr:S-adenosyl-L-methionine dependent methyltransferase [Mycena pura]